MDKKSQTIQTYEKSAKALATKFNSLGARVSDIEEVFALIKKKNPNVLEIGCANGRDAKEILKHTNNYLGIDISKELIKLAHRQVPEGNFQVHDIVSFGFPKNLDIVFAFASLIHIDKADFQLVMSQIYEALNSQGIVRLSLKYAPIYSETTKEDEFGTRTYYLYSPDDIRKIAVNFSILKEQIHETKTQKWLEVILQK